MKRGEFVKHFPDRKVVDIRPFIADQVLSYIADHPETEMSMLSPAGWVLEEVMKKTEHVGRHNNIAAAGKNLSESETISDYYTNIVYAWKRSDTSARGKPRLAEDTFYWFFLCVADTSYFTEIARKVWPNTSETFMRFVYAKCGDDQSVNSNGIMARFQADIEEVRQEFRKLWIPAASGAPMQPPPYVTKEDIEYAIRRDADSGIWLNPHNHYSIPLSGRENEMKLLDEFMNDDRPFLICPVIAPSGAGKTRLISQWMKKYISSEAVTEWDAGLVNSTQPNARDPKPWEGPDDGGKWAITRDTLIVIDYTFAFDEVAKQIAVRARKQNSYRIRLVVIDHVFPKILQNDFFWQSAFDDQNTVDSRVRLELLDPIEIAGESASSDIIRDIIASIASSSERRYKSGDIEVKNAALTLFQMGAEAENPNAVRHPLFAALMGHAIRSGCDVTRWNRQHLFEYYFNKKQRTPWKNWADERGVAVAALVSAATLRRGLPVRNIRKLLPDKPDEIIQYANRIVSFESDALIQPFEPDILGEAFLLYFLSSIENNPAAWAQFFNFLCAHRNQGEAEQIAVNFQETVARLARNLVNDDQSLPSTRAGWEALSNLLKPKNFQCSELLESSISMALLLVAHTISEAACRHTENSDLDNGNGFYIDLIADFYEPIGEQDLKMLVNTNLFYEASRAYIRHAELSPKYASKEVVKRLQYIAESLKQYIHGSWSPLMVAVHLGLNDTVKTLLMGALSKDEKARLGVSEALFTASQMGNHFLVSKLISSGANPNQVNEDFKETPMKIASSNGHLKIVKILYGSGANINWSDLSGENVLAGACRGGHLDVVDFLVGNGAITNPDTVITASSPLGSAIQARKDKIVEYMLDTKASVEGEVTEDGWSPLMQACLSGYKKTVQILISKGANINRKSNPGGLSALSIACAMDFLDLVEFLIDEGVDVNTYEDGTGHTPLMIASLYGFDDIAEALLSCEKIDLEITDKGGATALEIAVVNGNLEIAKIIQNVRIL